MFSADGSDETSRTGSLGSRRARREHPADRRRIPRHPRHRHPRSGRRGPRGEKAVAGNAAVQSLRWSEDDQEHDPRHVAHDDHRLSHRRIRAPPVRLGPPRRYGPGIGLVAAAASTGFAAIAVGLGAAYTKSKSPRSLFLHPGPAMLIATAALAWWG